MREFVQSQKAGSWHVIGMSTEAGSNSTRACTTPGGEAPRSTESCGMGRSGRSQVRWVVSWPPPWVPVPMNVVTALPTSEPFCHSEPVASQNALNWAAGEPYLQPKMRDRLQRG